jgi:hypothetical protein
LTALHFFIAATLLLLAAAWLLVSGRVRSPGARLAASLFVVLIVALVAIIAVLIRIIQGRRIV